MSVHELVRHRRPRDSTGVRGIVHPAVAALFILDVLCVDDPDLFEVATVEPEPPGLRLAACCPGAEAAESPPELAAEGADVAELVAA